MCIIAISEEGVKPLTEEILKTCFENNSDGAGFTWWDGWNWQVRKGFMKWKKFKKAYNAMHFEADTLVMCHFRIGTSGNKDGGNCHPFPVCQDYNKMRKKSFQTSQIVIHNGVIGSGEGIASDTMKHIKKYIAPLTRYSEDKDLEIILRESLKTTSCRWVITNGPIYNLYGEWHDHDEGWKFSNTSYKPRVTTTTTTYHNNTNYGWGYGSTGYGDSYRDRYYTGNRFDYNKWKNDRDRGRTPIANGNQAKRFVLDGKVTYTRPTDHEAFIIGYVDNSGAVEWQGEVPATKSTQEGNEYKHDQYLFCPDCDEDNCFMDSPFTVGDTLCVTCGCVFESKTGEIITYDEDMRKSYNDNLSKEVNDVD